MKFHRKLILTIFSIYFIFTLGWNGYLYMLPKQSTEFNFYFNLLYAIIYFAGGGISIIYAIVFGIRSNLGKILFFLGTGLFSYSVGLLLWFYYNLLKVDIPYPSYADVAFLIFYPLMLIGSILLVRIYTPFIKKAVIRDSIIISFLTFVVVFLVHTRIDLSNGIPLTAKIVNIAYPVLDVVIMSIGLIAIRIGGGKLHPSFYLFSLGLLIQGAGDLVFDYRTTNNLYWNGDIADTLFLLSGYILSISLFEIIHNLTQVSSTSTATPGPLLPPKSDVPPQTQPIPVEVQSQAVSGDNKTTS